MGSFARSRNRYLQQCSQHIVPAIVGGSTSTDSGPEWPRAGVARRCRVAGRRAVSASQSRRPPSTPDGLGTAPARIPARPACRSAALPGEGCAARDPALGLLLDRQFSGPSSDWTPGSPLPGHRGGPQSFTAAAPRGLATRGAKRPAGEGSGDPRQARGLPDFLHRAAIGSPVVARQRRGVLSARPLPCSGF